MARKLRFRTLVALALLAFPPAVRGADLRIGLASAATSMDPHLFNASANNCLAMHVFDQLTHRSPDGTIVPWLAEKWMPAGDTNWEFKLRPGVKFHDGSTLAAGDVAFTLSRIAAMSNNPGGFSAFIRAIDTVDVIDAATIRLHTRGPAPNLPGDLASIAIVSRTAGTGASAVDYNTGKAAIGTGPYRLEHYIDANRVELTGDPGWWGGKPEWDRLSIRFIANGAARVAALIADDVDIVDAPPAAILPRLKDDPNLSVFSVDGLRVIFLFLDLSHEPPGPFIAGLDGTALPHNPLRDPRVRRALSIAINRPGLVDRIMLGTAAATGQWLPPGAFGYAAAVPVPRHDPEQAKSLLAEAGYPDGFKVTLHTPNDRYPNDAATAQAVAQMWARIGVQTSVETLPWTSYPGHASRQEFAAGLLGWGNATMEAGTMLINIIGTHDPKTGRGTANFGRFSDPVLDALTDRALATLDDTARNSLLVEAVTRATDQVPIIPLYTLVNFWAARKGIVYEARRDELTLALNAHLAK